MNTTARTQKCAIQTREIELMPRFTIPLNRKLPNKVCVTDHNETQFCIALHVSATLYLVHCAWLTRRAFTVVGKFVVLFLQSLDNNEVLFSLDNCTIGNLFLPCPHSRRATLGITLECHPCRILSQWECSPPVSIFNQWLSAGLVKLCLKIPLFDALAQTSGKDLAKHEAITFTSQHQSIKVKPVPAPEWHLFQDATLCRIALCKVETRQFKP